MARKLDPLVVAGVIADVTDYFSPSVKMSVTYNTNKQIDGFEQEKKVVVIAATNRMQDLDPALISRFDSMITFGLPDQQTRQEIAAQSIKVMMESGCEEVQNPRANLRRKRQRKRENLEDGPNISWQSNGPLSSVFSSLEQPFSPIYVIRRKALKAVQRPSIDFVKEDDLHLYVKICSHPRFFEHPLAFLPSIRCSRFEKSSANRASQISPNRLSPPSSLPHRFLQIVP
ncbi:ATP-dependent zinc metalloprotease FtsH 4 [Camellia lanceoleosa]|uniref:ATP-dependent zinc metalloprotease FtsH 4 n=1 Tax=Camellia lanceoleosa TaxID=1840588 RepID=A0ACC0HPG3_9ERIC|nr:ATP-dependent zinc metalloprotease FtsH 4 [Camellia lanceoleosa]